MYGVAILPCDERIDPWEPTQSEYLDGDECLYVLAPSGYPDKVSRVVASSGDLGREFAVGTEHEFRHDQTARRIGVLQVVGIIDHQRRIHTGNVPHRRLSLSVFK